MGSTNSIIFVTEANTTIDLNDYKCSDRGLILPRELYFSLKALQKQMINLITSQ